MLTRKEGEVKKENNNSARTKKNRLLKGRDRMSYRKGTGNISQNVI
jgi:hypothetical protein